MNNEILYDIVKAYYDNKVLSLSDDINKDELIKLCKDQALLPYLYPVYKTYEFKKYYLASLLVSEKFESLQAEITDLMTKNQIKHLFFKGTVIKDYYPDKVLRTRGDIDFLVSEEDYQRAKKILEENGYDLYCEEAYHHRSYIKNDLEVEVHRFFLPAREDYADFFLDPFSFSYQKEGFTYNLNLSSEFLFGLCHYVKHIKASGAGIRPIIDAYILMKNSQLDYKYLEAMTKELNLFNFYQTVLAMVDRIFGFKPIDYVKVNTEDFSHFILYSGIHGANNNHFEVQRVNENNGRVGYLFKKLFRPYKEMKVYYPILKKLPVLLPIFYIRRFFSLWKSKKKIKQVFVKDNFDKEKFKKMMKDIGL